MAIAFLAAKRSKDPNTQVGACIVNEDKKIVGIGYNGMPKGCNDDEFPWKRGSNNSLDTKHLYGTLYIKYSVSFDKISILNNILISNCSMSRRSKCCYKQKFK